MAVWAQKPGVSGRSNWIICGGHYLLKGVDGARLHQAVAVVAVGLAIRLKIKMPEYHGIKSKKATFIFGYVDLQVSKPNSSANSRWPGP